MIVPAATVDALTRLFAPLAERAMETCAIVYLDAAGRLLGSRHVVGTANAVELSVRTIAADAMTFDARAAVMAHNHPSGDPTPSQADLAFTRALASGLDALGVRLGDHVIVSRDGLTSLRATGLL